MQYSCTKGGYCVQTPEEMMNFRWTFSLPKFLKNLLFNGDKSWTLSFLFSSGLNFHFDMYFICWFYWKIPLWSKCQATKSSEFALSGILIITERPTGRKCCSISWRFHDIKVSLINSETLTSSQSPLCDDGLFGEPWILPNFHTRPITNSPYNPFSRNIESFKNASPNIAHSHLRFRWKRISI
jgi:hypothetical protein